MIKGCAQEDVYYTIRLLNCMGFIKVYAGDAYRKNDLSSNEMSRVFIQRLIWEGHEFLTNASEPSVWRRAKKAGWKFLLKSIQQYLEMCTEEFVRSALSKIV